MALALALALGHLVGHPALALAPQAGRGDQAPSPTCGRAIVFNVK